MKFENVAVAPMDYGNSMTLGVGFRYGKGETAWRNFIKLTCDMSGLEVAARLRCLAAEIEVVEHETNRDERAEPEPRRGHG